MHLALLVFRTFAALVAFILYETLQSNLITATASQRSLLDRDPTAVVDIRLFRINQFPYLEVRR